MKKNIGAICFCLLLAFLGSCKKNNHADVSTSIVGSWELWQIAAGMNPNPYNYPPGNGHILKFSDEHYAIYENGSLVKSGQYLVIRDATVEVNVCLVLPSGQFTNRIIYDSTYDGPKVFLQISNNTLTFLSGCYAYDAGSRTEYKRVKSTAPGF